MTSHTVARRYAHALFEVARRNDTINLVERDLGAFQQLLADNAELQHLFDSSVVSAQKKRAVLDAVLEKSGARGGEVTRLLGMLADRDRLAFLPAIGDAFAERLRQDRRIMQAEVTTAVPLADAQRSSLTTALREAVGADVTITETVDPSIIGGVVARVGSLVFDGSVTRQLERMKQQLLQER
jgi:F-type H+-transporting ATPase subunit delta